MNTEEKPESIQNLLDVWERRPRRQLDYSLLSEESRLDVEWTTEVLRAMIPAARVIAEKFGMTGQPPIVIQMPPPLPLESIANGSPSDLNEENVPEHTPNDSSPISAPKKAVAGNPVTECKHDYVQSGNHPVEGMMVICQICGADLSPSPTAILSIPSPASGNDAPSKPPVTAPAKEPSNDNPRSPSKKVRTGAKKRRTKGKSGKSLVSAAKPAVTLSVPAPTPEQLSKALEPKPGAASVDLTDPPAPKLSEIG